MGGNDDEGKVKHKRSRRDTTTDTEEDGRHRRSKCKRNNKSDSSSSSSPERRKNKRSKYKTKRSSSSSSSTSEERYERKKRKKEKRKLKKELKKQRKKEQEKKDKALKSPEAGDEECHDVPVALMEKAKAMAPITKEEWEKRQSVVRKVYDEESGRHRLIKGDGEVIEEIVSRDRHKAINKQATQGDGSFFQSKLSSTLNLK